MKVLWLAAALAELDRVYDFIAQDNPAVARSVFKRIRKASERLQRFPDSGRPGQLPGTREIVVVGLPFVIVYRRTHDAVEILRVFHTSRERPEPFH